MHPFEVLGHPVRRRAVELLARSELSSGEIVDAVSEEFGISQSAVSQHLGVLREHGFATVRREGTRRLYSLDSTPLRGIDLWLDQFREHWAHRLAALDTEIARGKRARRLEAEVADDAQTDADTREHGS